MTDHDNVIRLMNKEQREARPIARVQIPIYTNWWMRGARFGDVVKVTKERGYGPRRIKGSGPTTTGVENEIAHVKLDINGKTIKVILADCTEID